MSGEVQVSPLASPAVGSAVALQGITKRFPAVLANDRVEFEAAEGEVHALLGENGAGKTTLSNILTGLYRPDDGEREAGEAVLELDGVSAHGDRGTVALRDVSLSVRAGEIVAIAGVAGNGQRELAETIAGMRPTVGGSVRVRGRRLRGGDPRQAIRAGVAYVPEDRLGTGVAPGLTIASNVVLKSYREPEVSRGPLLRLGRIRELAHQVIRRYDVRTSGPDVPAWQLSGGNLQKVVLAREFSGAPAVLVAAAPTRGLDVAGIETVHRYLREAAADGVGVLVISEDLDEILALADRIAVMYEGSVVGERDAATATVEELGLLMAGGEGEED